MYLIKWKKPAISHLFRHHNFALALCDLNAGTMKQLVEIICLFQSSLLINQEKTGKANVSRINCTELRHMDRLKSYTREIDEYLYVYLYVEITISYRDRIEQ